MEMATVLMDKLFFQIAVNSFKGIFGTTKGNARLTDIQSGLLSPISSISRLMWGMGIFNHFIQGTVLLACMEKYGLPIVIQNIALDTKNAPIINRTIYTSINPEAISNRGKSISPLIDIPPLLRTLAGW